MDVSVLNVEDFTISKRLCNKQDISCLKQVIFAASIRAQGETDGTLKMVYLKRIKQGLLQSHRRVRNLRRVRGALGMQPQLLVLNTNGGKAEGRDQIFRGPAERWSQEWFCRTRQEWRKERGADNPRTPARLIECK